MDASPVAFIVFPDSHLLYAPSVLNSIRVLAENKYRVYVVYAGAETPDLITDSPIHYVSSPSPALPSWLPARHKLSLFLGFVRLLCLCWWLSLRLKPCISIGFDSRGFLALRMWSNDAVYYSLEAKHDFYHYLSRILGVKKLAIQSHVRKSYLFPSSPDVKFWIIPNSPLSSPVLLSSSRATPIDSIRLVYSGTLIWSHFPLSIIQALELNDSYHLTLQGSANPEMLSLLKKHFSSLFRDGRVVIEDRYMSQDDLIYYLSGYDVGLCVYPEHLRSDFNYLTCPSGKMYNYFQAGLPCLGSDVPGLFDIRECQAGILLGDLSPKSIDAGIQSILKSYKAYKDGCAGAAKKFDFRSSFLSMLSSSNDD